MKLAGYWVTVRMKTTVLSLIILILSSAVRADEGLQSKGNVSRVEFRSKYEKPSNTYVVNYEVDQDHPLSSKKKFKKRPLNKIPTHAQLIRDPRADLPSAFSICSSVMTTHGIVSANVAWQMFFNLLGKDGTVWLRSLLSVAKTATSFLHVHWAEVKLPLVFPNQWVRSCMAINAETGFLQWVVDGVLVENATVDQLKDIENKPTDLSGRIVLGAWYDNHTGMWTSWLSNRVTNLNVFSTVLSVEEMQKMTEDENCGSEGDYLAWRDMQWSLKDRYGIARIESMVDAAEVCKSHPPISYYGTGVSWESCMRFCQKLESRSPSLVNLEEVETLRRDLKGLGVTNEVWLALHGAQEKWIDFYDEKLANFSIPRQSNTDNCAGLKPFVGPPGVRSLSCENAVKRCVCDRTPSHYIKLRGLCANSDIQDIWYQPSDGTFVGLSTLISFDNNVEVDRWTWQMRVTDSNVTGFSLAPAESYTLGRHNWTIKGDKGCNRDGGEYKGIKIKKLKYLPLYTNSKVSTPQT